MFHSSIHSYFLIRNASFALNSWASSSSFLRQIYLQGKPCGNDMGTHFLRHRALACWGTDVLVDIVELELMLLSHDAVKCTSARLLLSNHSKPYACSRLQLTTTHWSVPSILSTPSSVPLDVACCHVYL